MNNDNFIMQKNDRKKLELAGKIDACNKVETMLNTEGWKEVIEPLLNAMIEDVTGRKRDNRWVKGWIHKESEKALGYQDGLITLYNRIMEYKESREALQTAYANIDSNKKVFTTPMERSKYAPAKQKISEVM